MPRPLAPGRLLRAGLLALLLAGSTTPSVAAPVAAVETPGCEQAAIWRIAYRLYWRNPAGATLDRATLPEVQSAAETFARQVGEFSQCGVRVRLELYDEGDAVFAGVRSDGEFDPPDDTWELRDQGDYDAVFHRAPAVGNEGYAGQTDFTSIYFPVPAGDEREGSRPWAGLQMHEWLHNVVSFYGEISQGWPREDVHGASNYPPHAGMVDMDYFAEMMSGRVLEPDGSKRGILPHEYGYFGTPRHPLHVDPGLSVEMQEGHVTASANDVDGPVVLTLTNTATNQVVLQRAVRPEESVQPAPGHYRACASFAGTTRFRPAEACTTGTIHADVAKLISVRKARGRGPALSLRSHAPLTGRRATIRWSYTSGCSVLGCRVRVIKRRVTLKPSAKLRAPRARRRGEYLAATVDVSTFTIDGIRYSYSASKTFAWR